MLKECGLQSRRSIGSQFRRKVRKRLTVKHLLQPVIETLLSIHEQVCREQEKLDRQGRGPAREDQTTRRLMTVLGVGPATAHQWRPKRGRDAPDGSLGGNSLSLVYSLKMVAPTAAARPGTTLHADERKAAICSVGVVDSG